MRWGQALGATLVLGLAVLADVPSAHACSCAQGTPQQHFDGSDVVFVGEMTEAIGVGSTSNEAYYRFAVDRVFKGEVGAEVEIESPSQGPACGLELRSEVAYLVFADDEPRNDGVLRANSCNGTNEVRGDGPTRFGPGEVPDADVALPPPRGSDGEKRPYVIVLVGLAGAALIVAGGLRLRRS